MDGPSLCGCATDTESGPLKLTLLYLAECQVQVAGSDPRVDFEPLGHVRTVVQRATPTC